MSSLTGQVARLPQPKGLNQRAVRQLLRRGVGKAEGVSPPEPRGAERLPARQRVGVGKKKGERDDGRKEERGKAGDGGRKDTG